jgi:hypothetical protein
MKDEREIGNVASTNKWWSSRDASMSSYRASTFYSDAQKLAAERLRLGLNLVYASRAIHVNYRQKFITIKVEHPVVRDRRALALLEQDYERLGYKKRVSAQGVIYRIPKVDTELA